MTDHLELLFFIALLLILAPLLGRYLSFIFKDEPPKIPVLTFLENTIYRICGIQPKAEMIWKKYLAAVLYFNLYGLIFLFGLQLVQQWLPLNPQHFPAVEWSLALNTAISFVTNTNWQAYGGENSLSYLTQMMGMTVQNFLSAATGFAILIALIRGVIRQAGETVGNFWVDLTRTLVYVLLPFCLIFSLFLVSQGVIQNLSPYLKATTLENNTQTIPFGPVASQVAIKQVGTNGGGFFNANGAHPFENPTPLSNFFEMFAIFIIPAGTVFMYGRMVKSHKEGWVIFAVMFILWIGGLAVSTYSESVPNPVMGINPVLEGKETRFSMQENLLWAVTTTGTSNGSVNNMHSSLSPIAGGVALFNMMVGEVIFGGVGVGLCGMLMFVLLSVFLAGLMVGKTPEYLGKKIEKKEIQWVMLAVLAPSSLILIGSSITTLLPEAMLGLGNGGPHGLSEILYAFSSAAGNNGSAFAGLNANAIFYNLILGLVMVTARLTIIIPSLAIAGCLVNKKSVAPSIGTFTTDTSLFGIILINVIFIIAALTFFPSLSLGPIIEQLLMIKGESF